MSEKTNKIQNSMISQDAEGLDFEYILTTINEAPEDLCDFVEALRSIIQDKIKVNPSFNDGFVLSDRLSTIEIDRLNRQIALLEHKLRVVIENGLGPEDLKLPDI